MNGPAVGEKPLSRQALNILMEIHPLTGRGPYVFPSVRSAERPLSNVALLAALRRMGYEQGTVTVHGFRSTASTLPHPSLLLSAAPSGVLQRFAL